MKFTNIQVKLLEKIEKYHIRPPNIYNFDEKGFLIGICQAAKRICSIQHIRSKKILGTRQDGNREFISLLACICADGTMIPPGLIYQGESGDLQSTWLEDFDSSSELAYFGSSKKGWTNEELGMAWLTQIFDHHTRAKAGNSRRLLIVDGHSSHINMRFIEYCNQNNIILAVLPPHSTHRLQPLDIGIFGPLAKAYSNELDQLVQRSYGFSTVTKRMFWSLFRNSWEKVLTFENIRSAFAASGIFPYNPSKVLSKISRKTPSPIPSDDEKNLITPKSVRGVRRTVKAIAKEQNLLTGQIQQLVKAAEKLAIQNEILEHENRNLRQTLVDEKKRRKKGRPMGLFDSNQPGQARFFSPEKIAAVRQRAIEIEQQKEQERINLENKRFQRQMEREEKAKKIREAREARNREREKKHKEKEQQQLEKEEKKQEKLANQQLEKDQQKREKEKKVSTRQKRQQELTEDNLSIKKAKTEISRSGRQIQLPKRYCN